MLARPGLAGITNRLLAVKGSPSGPGAFVNSSRTLIRAVHCSHGVAFVPNNSAARVRRLLKHIQALSASGMALCLVLESMAGFLYLAICIRRRDRTFWMAILLTRLRAQLNSPASPRRLVRVRFARCARPRSDATGRAS